MQYSGYRGRLRDGRAGFEHGLFCVSCCWGLMLLLVAFGLMNLWAMTALAAVVVLEKVTSKGDLIAKASGIVAIALGFAVLWQPGVAPGLTAVSAMPGMAAHGSLDSTSAMPGDGAHRTLPDGTVVFPDGSMIMPDGTLMRAGDGAAHHHTAPEEAPVGN